MIPSDSHTAVHYAAAHFRGISSKADCLASLAIAVSLVAEGSVLPSKQQRQNVAADIVAAIVALSTNLSKEAHEFADAMARVEA